MRRPRPTWGLSCQKKKRYADIKNAGNGQFQNTLLYLYKEEFRFSYKAVAFVPCEIRPQVCRWVFRVTGVQEAGFSVTHNGH